jgi:hypothetical protein
MGRYDEIVSAGFDIEEILKSYNKSLSKTQKTKGFSAEKAREVGPSGKGETPQEPKKTGENLLVAEEKETGRVKF